MPAIHETAYPRFKPYLSAKEQEEIFRLSPEELSLLDSKTKASNQQSRFGFALLLKCYQYLGRPIQIEAIDNPIKYYVAKQLDIDKKVDVINYPEATFKRHKDIIREYLAINMDSHARRNVMKKAALDAAMTKEDLADIINCMLEELILNHFELPAYQGMVRLARAARTLIHYGHYRRISQFLSEEQKQRIDTILSPSEETTETWTWQAIKQEPKSPTPKNMKLFIDYVSQLKQLRQQFFVNLDFILPARLEHLRDEAMVIDQADMRKIGQLKRYALFAILLYMKSASAMDDLVQTLLVWTRKIENKAKEKLRDYLLAHADETDKLILMLYQILLTVNTQESAQIKLEDIENQLGGKAEEIIQACREHLGLVADKHLSWMLKPYRDKRGLLFNLLENLAVYSSHEDKALETALKFIKHHRSSHKEWMEIKEVDTVPVDLSVLSEAWFKLVTGKNKGEAITQVHRHYYELAVFYVLAGDLNCSDAYVENSFIYDDPNKQFITWEEFDDRIDDYCKVTKLPKQSDNFIAYMKEKIRSTAKKVDENYHENTFLSIQDGVPILKKSPTKPAHPEEDKIRQLVMAEMPIVSIIDILVDVEQWLNLSSGLKPLSGQESKIDNYPPRFIATTFCYGANMGPTQTERCLLSFTRKQIAWLFHHHATEQRIINVITKILNFYHKFELPKRWGPGDSASVDGTFMDMYSQNLLAAHHLRYGGYGGIGYFHISDRYIASFSNFISSAVHESVYLLDGVVENDSDMKIDTIYGDSWAQSEVLFGLSFLMGITIMPRIKRFKHLYYYKASSEDHYENIDEIFTNKPIDWELIRTHYHDMLRVVLSIKHGKVKSSTILRKLCSKSRKNKLYYAFRELGRVVRTDFLLNYINDADLRRIIQAATCKSEEFNEFLDWIRFGGGGVVADNLRFSQRKLIKFSHLLANMLILHTVVQQTKIINKLRLEGLNIPDEILARFSPYWREHVNRFGVLTLNMEKLTEKIDFTLNALIKA